MTAQVPDGMRRVDDGQSAGEVWEFVSDIGSADIYFQTDGSVEITTDEQPGGNVAARFTPDVLRWLIERSSIISGAASQG